MGVEMSIHEHEKEIKAGIVSDSGQMFPDANSKRIKFLIQDYLQFVCNDSSGWNKLYQDPKDHRYWEKFFLQSDMHGGGLPSLRVVSEERLLKIYGIGKKSN